MSIKIGGQYVVTSTAMVRRFTSVIWGPPKCGKTVLASTGRKPMLYLQFDPDGTASVKPREDLHVVDLSAMPDEVVAQFQMPSSTAIGEVRTALKDIGAKCLVLDSLTAVSNKAAVYGVQRGATLPSKDQDGKPTMERPGFLGYGIKSMVVNQMIRNLNTVTKECDCDFIMIAHEDVPKLNSDGSVRSQTLMLGSSLSVEIPKDVNEVWHMEVNAAYKRVIHLEPYAKRGPIGTRMFDTNLAKEFVWKYNPVTEEGDGIATWFAAWEANGFQKIKVP